MRLLKKETDLMLDKISIAQSEMDKKCHDLFLNKEILAPILRETIEEYKGLSVGEIIELIEEYFESLQDSQGGFLWRSG